jgi:predicted membrane protein
MTKSTFWSTSASAWDRSNVAADTRHGVMVGAVAAIAIVGLGLRGRPILDAFAVFAPIVAKHNQAGSTF